MRVRNMRTEFPQRLQSRTESLKNRVYRKSSLAVPTTISSAPLPSLEREHTLTVYPRYQAQEFGEKQMDTRDTAGLWEMMRVTDQSSKSNREETR
ncbi:hypothetical protein LDENG_00099090 [Lucifuga dentata]|nr:hypothetical protein LDENG_00099090 [Lucifuga dentata]